MSYPSAELTALANDTRAQILQKLERGPLTVGEIASGLPVSRPAISQHLRVLEDAKLVSEEYQGTRHIYRLDLTGLIALRAWLDRFWTTSLDAFAAEVDRQNRLEASTAIAPASTPATATPAPTSAPAPVSARSAKSAKAPKSSPSSQPAKSKSSSHAKHRRSSRS